MLRYSDPDFASKSKTDNVSSSISDCDSGFHELGVLSAPLVRSSIPRPSKGNSGSPTSKEVVNVKKKPPSKSCPASRTQSTVSLNASPMPANMLVRVRNRGASMNAKRESSSSLSTSEDLDLSFGRSSTESPFVIEKEDKFSREIKKEFENGIRVRGYTRHAIMQDYLPPTIRDASVTKSTHLVESTTRKRRPKPRSKSADANRRGSSKGLFSPVYSKILDEGEMARRREWAAIIKKDCILEEEYYKVPYEECNREVILGRFSRSEPKLNFRRKSRKKVSFSEDTDTSSPKEQRRETVNAIKRNVQKTTNLDTFAKNSEMMGLDSSFENKTLYPTSNGELGSDISSLFGNEKDPNSNLHTLIQLIREIKTSPQKGRQPDENSEINSHNIRGTFKMDSGSPSENSSCFISKPVDMKFELLPNTNLQEDFIPFDVESKSTKINSHDVFEPCDVESESSSKINSHDDFVPVSVESKSSKINPHDNFEPVDVESETSKIYSHDDFEPVDLKSKLPKINPQDIFETVDVESETSKIYSHDDFEPVDLKSKSSKIIQQDVFEPVNVESESSSKIYLHEVFEPGVESQSPSNINSQDVLEQADLESESQSKIYSQEVFEPVDVESESLSNINSHLTFEPVDVESESSSKNNSRQISELDVKSELKNKPHHASEPVDAESEYKVDSNSISQSLTNNRTTPDTSYQLSNVTDGEYFKGRPSLVVPNICPTPNMVESPNENERTKLKLDNHNNILKGKSKRRGPNNGRKGRDLKMGPERSHYSKENAMNLSNINHQSKLPYGNLNNENIKSQTRAKDKASISPRNLSNEMAVQKALRNRAASKKRHSIQRGQRNGSEEEVFQGKHHQSPHIRNDSVNIFMRQNANFTDHHIELTTCVNSYAPNVSVTRMQVPFSAVRDQWEWAKHFWPLPAMANFNGSQLPASNLHTMQVKKVSQSSPSPSEEEYFSRESSPALYSKDNSVYTPTKEEISSPTPSCWSSSGSSSSGCFSASCSPSPLPTTLRVFPLPTPL